MVLIIGVRFRKSGKVYYFDPLDLDIKKNDHVIVETARGVEYGTVVLAPKEVEKEKIVQPLKPVMRIATPQDDATSIENEKKEKEIPDESITDISNPDPIYPPAPLQGAGYDGMGYEEAREIVKENIEYDILVQDPRQDREQLDEVVELIAETLCSRRQTIVVAGDEYPAEMVKEKLLRVNSMHIGYVFDCLKQNTTYVRNIKKYLLASLFNAPSTIGSYYSALVNHDMYGDGLRGR